MQELSDDDLAAQTDLLKEKVTAGGSLDDLLPGSIRRGTRSCPADAEYAAFRRSAHRRHGASPGEDSGDAHG